MHHASGPAPRQALYLTQSGTNHHHKSHLNRPRTSYELELPRHTPDSQNIMSSADDRNNNSNATAPRGRRGRGRAQRARARGRGFHFNHAAQEALTQHLMHRGRGLQPAASDPVSLTIGNYHDAPLNARKIDKNVYPTAATSLRPTPSTSTIPRLAKTYRAH